MGGIKRSCQVELNQSHVDWLKEMMELYGLFDEDKALRIVLEYVMDEADHETIFTEVRCNHCQDSKNQD
tara:strand:+ start:52630 stop:52836 length:207 start_codon:yes stop_codon:yes gene_type:complete